MTNFNKKLIIICLFMTGPPSPTLFNTLHRPWWILVNKKLYFFLFPICLAYSWTVHTTFDYSTYKTDTWTHFYPLSDHFYPLLDHLYPLCITLPNPLMLNNCWSMPIFTPVYECVEASYRCHLFVLECLSLPCDHLIRHVNY